MAEAITRRGRRVVTLQLIVLALAGGASLVESAHASLSAAGGVVVAMLLAWMLRRTMARATELAVESPQQSMNTMYLGAAVRFVALLALMAVGLGLLKLDARFMVGAFVVALVVGVLAARGQDSGRPTDQTTD
ncbi:ATP synthase subunit I [Guyparkeria sp.]|uniref:ATP synthase subunit I n=1 Tax=Guyparkeria sp. TaxID=2035736 RepID=UPI0039704BD3